jgi:hypothetical protein
LETGQISERPKADPLGTGQNFVGWGQVKSRASIAVGDGSNINPCPHPCGRVKFWAMTSDLSPNTLNCSELPQKSGEAANRVMGKALTFNLLVNAAVSGQAPCPKGHRIRTGAYEILKLIDAQSGGKPDQRPAQSSTGIGRNTNAVRAKQ